ncbi:acyl-CoA dehydrogenase [Pseudomonas chlororaphis]|uniref:acyl-CoA dehydrogenase n=1 Tax=Pseudomonas chlororaphis TaxID=587753 RepID=UPI0023665A98|nr:acyl-CoA dehydrogenase [Pseudomonas chlororaphis]WDG53846.1 acyl-CoA dehydrogenase [Pseudomonas chlororaphis]WDH90953.1 acyl-CoA dehydrogenase [Pseudomonas chlororaphis]
MNALSQATAHETRADEQAEHSHDDLRRARELLQSTLKFVREQAKPWPGSGLARASDDPYVISRFGDLLIRIEVAAALQERAQSLLAREHDVAEIGVAQAEAAIASREALLAVSNAEFELTGQRSPLPAAQGEPLRWKYPLIGNYRLNGVVPPSFRSAV